MVSHAAPPTPYERTAATMADTLDIVNEVFIVRRAIVDMVAVDSILFGLVLLVKDMPTASVFPLMAGVLLEAAVMAWRYSDPGDPQ